MNILAIGVLALVASDPVVEERTEYYDVTGSSAWELHLAMRERGPRGARGAVPWVSSSATTAWDVRTQGHYSQGDGRCAVESVSTSVRIVTTMPRWANRVEGSALARSWDRMMRGLAAHERRHAENGILAAKAIQERVSALAPARTCGELDHSVKAASNALIETYRGADSVYDVVAPEIPFNVLPEDETVAIPRPLPSPSPSPAAADAALTDTERQRRAGTAHLEAEMAALSELADSAGAAWRRYVAACPWTTKTMAVGASGGREWFDDAWPGARSTGQTRQCAEAEEFFVLADEVKRGICRADERARQAFVYPGTRRDLQTKFRLYSGGWDRACP